MGIGLLLLFWAFVGVVLAICGSILGGYVADNLTRGLLPERAKLIRSARFLPFICLVWVTTVFLGHAFVNESIFHRDSGIGDSWKCPLPDGYVLMGVDTLDRGIVYNPKTQSDESIGAQDDAVDDVEIIQVAGRYIFGGTVSQSTQDSHTGAQHIDSFFILDTQIGKHTNFPSKDALNVKAQELGVNLNLEGVAAAYIQYRFGWFDVLAGLLLILPPGIGIGLLARRIIQLRKTLPVVLNPV